MAATAADTSVMRTSARTLSATDWGIFIVRIFLGVVFLMHGSQKVLGVMGGKGLAATAAGMSGMLALPEWLIYVSIFTEFLGGILLILGLLSRLCGIGLLINMAVAIALVHGKNGFFLPSGFEYAMTLLGMALAIIIAGPGAAAVADWEGKLFRR